MSADGGRGALDALSRARPAVERLDTGRGPAESGGDILDVWNAVEASLRALVGNDALAGQSLIREARARQLIGFEQANALAEFAAARDRVERTGYRPTDADVNAARIGYLKLEQSLVLETPALSAPVQPSSSGGSAWAPPPNVPPLQAAVFDPIAAGLTPLPARRSPWLMIGIIAGVVIIALGVGGYFAFGIPPTNKSLDEGVQFYAQGQREAAAGAFTTAARQNPKDPRPHIYLARMAREAGNLTLANQELQLAIQADPSSALALREMGAYLLAAGNNDLAVKFYAHALDADSTDKVAMGWLGCALTRMNRVPEAQRWVERAGYGDWSRCTAHPPTAAVPGRAGPLPPRRP